MLLFDDKEIARKPVKLQKENSAACAGEGKQKKENIEERRTVDSTQFEFCDEITRRRSGREGGENKKGKKGRGNKVAVPARFSIPYLFNDHD